MGKKNFDRRHFLQTAGGFSLALPFLPSLLPQALAQAVAPPKRIIICYHPYGHLDKQFFPSVAADQRFADDVWYKKLADISGAVSPVFHSGWDAHRSKMNIYRGVDQTSGAGHNSTIPLCASSLLGVEGESSPPKYGRAMDIIMQKSPALYANTPHFSALRIAEGFYNQSVSWEKNTDGTHSLLPVITGNKNVFDFVFNGVPTSPGQPSPDADRKILITDRILERFNHFMANPRLGADDKRRLASHVDGMNQLEKKIIESKPAVCTRPGQMAVTLIEQNYNNYADVIASAFTCDLTRVAYLGIFNMSNSTTLNRGDWHGLSHYAYEATPGSAEAIAAEADHLAYSKFVGDRVLYLVNKLASIREADGTTLLDNTIILWTSELSMGKHHRGESIPVVTIGNAGSSRLKTGYNMDYRIKPITHLANRTDFPAMGRSYTQMLITMMQLMGVQPSEYMSYGDGGGYGEFSDTTQYSDGKYTPFKAQRNNPLPFIFT